MLEKIKNNKKILVYVSIIILFTVVFSYVIYSNSLNGKLKTAEKCYEKQMIKITEQLDNGYDREELKSLANECLIKLDRQKSIIRHEQQKYLEGSIEYDKIELMLYILFDSSSLCEEIINEDSIYSEYSLTDKAERYIEWSINSYRDYNELKK